VANAEAAGAIGAILYSDPADSGWGQGLSYPEGGWYDGHSIQRGTILSLPYPGDPLTPGEPALRDAGRRNPETVGLPAIPGQPIGWDAASRILSRMEGRPVPDDAWQGGLPFRYRLEGGPLLSVRLAVEQERKLRRTENVIARLPGRVSPQELVIVGCHHDAWSFGASDPNAGSVVLFEVARGFAELARRGVRPRRTLVFAHWAAEEQGIQGSTEWVEGRENELRNDAVAYLNLDMAAMGGTFGGSASPSLAPLVREVALQVLPDAGPEGLRVREVVGGGSDHVPFAFRVGVPTAGLGVYGADGSAYHTNYDTLRWYRQVVGPDYQGALELARVVGVVVARLANADVVPLDSAGYAGATESALEELVTLAGEQGLELDVDRLHEAVERFRQAAEPTLSAMLDIVDQNGFTDGGLAGLNWELRQMERVWLDDEGLPGRPWYRSLLAAPDPERGYAAWSLPLLRQAIESEDLASVGPAVDRYERVFQLLAERFRTLARMVRPLETPEPALLEPAVETMSPLPEDADEGEADPGIEEEDIE
jgi:N-acetylated-alpha-linked acidic dipeptidase